MPTATPTGETTPALNGPVVVGVYVGQPVEVLLEAARLATGLGEELVCVHVTSDVLATAWDRPEYFDSLADVEDEEASASLEPALESAINAVLQTLVPSPTWSLRVLAGGVSTELAAVASELAARAIVVGGPRRGIDQVLIHIANGTVAAQLLHARTHPVLVVPSSGRHTEQLAAHAGSEQTRLPSGATDE